MYQNYQHFHLRINFTAYGTSIGSINISLSTAHHYFQQPETLYAMIYTEIQFNTVKYTAQTHCITVYVTTVNELH